MAKTLLIVSLLMVIPAVVYSLPGVRASGGILGPSLVRYSLLALGAFTLGTSLHLLRPGVAERYDRKILKGMADPVAVRSRKLRNIALVLVAVSAVEISLMPLAWSSYEGRGLALSVLGSTLLLLIIIIIIRVRLAQGKAT